MADLHSNIIPESLYPVSGEVSVGNAVACDYVNVGKAEMAWIVIHAVAAGATDFVCTPMRAYTAAGGGAAVIVNTVPIWYGITIAGVPTPVLTRVAVDAVNYTTGATAGDHIVIFQIDPAGLGYEATVPSLGAYKYINCLVVGEAADYVSVMFWIKPHYGSRPASMRSFIT